jgi:hypothetical protein
MSILNHFGKVTASYKKYNSDVPDYKGYAYHTSHGKEPYIGDQYNLIINPYSFNRGGKIYFDGGIGRFGLEHIGAQKTYIEETRFTLEDILPGRGNNQVLNTTTTPSGAPYYYNVMTIPLSTTYNPSISPELYVFSFTTLVETFSKCIKKVREKMSSELWKTMEYCPLINIMDLLILKHSDTDKHIEHLEEIIKALIDDTKLLQTKINTLETQSVKAIQPVTTIIDDKLFNKLLQGMESTILKQNNTDICIQRAEARFEMWNNALKQDNKKLVEKIGLLEKEINILKNIPTAVAIQTFSVGEEMLYDV